jgi:hypothetical protein
MSFFQVILESLTIFGINALLSSLLFILLRPYIRNKLEEWIQNTISGYIREQLTLTLQHPEETAKTFAPLINAIIKEIMKDFQSSQKESMVKIPFLGKVPASIAQALIERFLGGSSKNEGSNPFA